MINETRTALVYEYLGDVRLNQGLIPEEKKLHLKAYHDLLGRFGQNHFWIGSLLYRFPVHEMHDGQFDQAR
jgi:hypothetical protein